MNAHIRASLRWTYGASALNLLLQLGFAAAITRLVAPVDYGMMAVAGGVVGYLAYFSDLGIGQAAMRDRALEVGDVWGMALVALAGNLLVVAVVWAAAAAIAGVVGLPPQGEAVLRLLALVAPLAGLNAAAQAWLNREMDFRRLGMVSVAGRVIGQGMVTLPMAWAGLGVWALVAGALAQPLVGLVLALWQAPARLPRWSQWRRVITALRLGANFSLIRVLDATQNNLIPLAAATWAGTAAAGLYDRGALLSLVVLDLAVGGVGRVLMPTYCRLAQHDPERLAETFQTYTRRVLCLALPAAAGLGVAASPLVLTLLGAGWAEVVMPLRLLAAVAACRAVSMMAGALVEARGSLRGHVAQRSAVLAALVAWLLAVRPQGLDQILSAALAAELASAVLLLVLAAKALRLSVPEVVRMFVPAASVALPVAAVVSLVLVLSPGAVPAARLALAVFFGATVGAGMLLFHPNRTLRMEMREIFRRMGVR